VSKNNNSQLIEEYHRGSLLMSLAILPIGIFLAFFSKEVLAIWTSNSELTNQTFLLVSLLVIGNTLNGIVHLPYALQLAHGWTKLAIYQNLVAVVVLCPTIYWASITWGAAGAASSWIVLNLGYLLVGNQIMHSRLLVKEKFKWYLNDVLVPLSVVITVCALGRLVYLNVARGIWIELGLLTLIFTGATLAIIVTSQFRSEFFKQARKLLNE